MMNWFDQLHVLALTNWILCSCIGIICLCRLAKMGRHTRFKWVLLHAGLIAAASASGWQPVLFGNWPSTPDVLLSVIFLWYLYSLRCLWDVKGGPEFTWKYESAMPTEIGQP